MKAFALILIVLLSTGAVAQAPTLPPTASNEALSATTILPACKEFLKDAPVLGPAEIFCSAVILTVLAVGNFEGSYLVCPPEGVTLEQGIRVVIMALDTYPEVQHENFSMLAIYILNRTWPCAKPTQEMSL